MLENLKKLNPEVELYDVSDKEFASFGRIIKSIDAAEIIETAKKEGEKRHKELVSEAKKEINALKQEHEKEVRDRKQEIADLEKKVDQREDRLDARSLSLDKREESLTVKENKIEEATNIYVAMTKMLAEKYNINTNIMMIDPKQINMETLGHGRTRKRVLED